VVSPAVDRLVGVVSAGAGWSAAPGELGALLRRLRCLSGQELKDRGMAARALAGRYSWDAVAVRYEVAYAEVLASGMG